MNKCAAVKLIVELYAFILFALITLIFFLIITYERPSFDEYYGVQQNKILVGDMLIEILETQYDGIKVVDMITAEGISDKKVIALIEKKLKSLNKKWYSFGITDKLYTIGFTGIKPSEFQLLIDSKAKTFIGTLRVCDKRHTSAIVFLPKTNLRAVLCIASSDVSGASS